MKDDLDPIDRVVWGLVRLAVLAGGVALLWLGLRTVAAPR